MKEIKITLTEEEEIERLDKLLARLAPDFSRSYIKKLMDNQAVLVNGKVTKPSYMAGPGDELVILAPDTVELSVEPENIPLDIVYEDKDVILVNKPKGMVVHPANGHEKHTLVNALLYHCTDLSGINGVMRPGIVHRIDRDTTGILIVCKNDKAHISLAEQLKEHSVNRHYKALCHGLIKEDELTIDAPIGRDPVHRKRMAVNHEHGKHAVTHVKVLERFRTPKGDFTFVDCRLETGRTHQIRVHLASLHHPLVGDTVYGPLKPAFPIKGQALHAYVLGFIHPSTGEYKEFSVPLPDYFEELLEGLRKTTTK